MPIKKNKRYPLTATEKKRKEANRKRWLKSIERIKKKKRIERERIKKAKKPRLLASNPLVKEAFLAERTMSAMGENISDWREEAYCERPGAPVKDLEDCIKDGYKTIGNVSKKQNRLFKKILKIYGKEQEGALREFVEYPTRYTKGTSFLSMSYKEKQKVHII